MTWEELAAENTALKAQITKLIAERDELIEMDAWEHGK